MCRGDALLSRQCREKNVLLLLSWAQLHFERAALGVSLAGPDMFFKLEFACLALSAIPRLVG